MFFSKIFDRYLFKEMLIPFSINVVFFTFIFLMARMLDITNLVVNYNIGLDKVLKLFFYLTPYFLVFVIPMSVMMAILLTFMRLSADKEIVALKAGGIGVYRLLPPALLLCTLGAGLTFFMAVVGQPWGELSAKRLTVQVAAEHIDVGLKARVFNDSFKDVMIYVNQVDTRNNYLIDVFIEDSRSEKIINTVVAPKGRLFKETEQLVFHLVLYNGSIIQSNLSNHTANAIRFETYDVRLDLHDALAGNEKIRKGRNEMSLTELRVYIESLPPDSGRRFRALREFHRKFSIPAACFVLGFLAIPLGIQTRAKTKSTGLVTGLGLFLLYYMILSLGVVFSESDYYPPVVSMWMPNLVMGCIALFLFIRVVRERQFVFSLTDWFGGNWFSKSSGPKG
jgi:lipopolysaccharide export system permease protein